MSGISAYFSKQTSNKNNAIAFASRRIPYLPELRQYCQTVNACLLMTQLEYRFGFMPNGFYKFLSPCENKLYRQGDSWIEELSFSEAELRHAFDQIAVRYRSKKSLDETIMNQQDPFQGKAYLSYIDVKNGLTYYLRNHDFVNGIIESSLNQFAANQYQPDLSLSSEDPQSPEINYLHLRRLTKCISGDEVSTSVYKEALEDTKENKAAEADPDIQKIEQPAAALSDFSLNTFINDLLIDETLTDSQYRQITDTVTQLQKTGYLKHLPFEDALQSVCDTILSATAYTQAGKDFTKKLNTVKKSIQNGTWTPPLDAVLKKEAQAKKLRDDEIKAETERYQKQQAAFEKYCAEHFNTFLKNTQPSLIQEWIALWRKQARDSFALSLVKQAEREGFKHPAVRAMFKAFLLKHFPAVYAVPVQMKEEQAEILE